MTDSVPTEDAGAPFRFADLFAGIGGFAAALRGFGGIPVYSVEIDPVAAKVYELNWGHSPLGDIVKHANDEVMLVPEHDILAAGFPCQPFSKSGAQRGMDETRGTLFWHILEVVKAHHPTVIILENVRNIAGPRHHHEWQVIIERLRAEHYFVSEVPTVFSPHLLPRERGGRPHVRERVFITATYDPDGVMAGRTAKPPVENRSLREVEWNLEADLPLDPNHYAEAGSLSDDETAWIEAWADWVDLMWKIREAEADASGEPIRPLPGFPIWVDDWRTIDVFAIPAGTPSWKAGFLRKNAQLYTDYREPFDAWVERHGVRAFPPSRRKFEWQAQETRCLWDCVMQMRPSGIRAKRPTHVPALVAITQTSIVGPRKRRLSAREAARLQGLPDNFTFGSQSPAATYRQLGNGVNVGVVWHVLREHAKRDEDILKTTDAGQRIFHALVTHAPDNPDDVLESVVRDAQARVVDVLGDPMGRKFRGFVLPHAEHAPAQATEHGVGVLVSRPVRSELGPPPLGVLPRSGPMLGAAVPEAPVDKDCYARLGERDVDGAPTLARNRIVDPESKAASV